MERLIRELFSLSHYRTKVWGVHVSEESAYCHAWHSGANCLGTTNWGIADSPATPCGSTYQSFTKCTVPVSNISQALSYFHSELGAYGLPAAKTVVMEANHNSIIDDCTPVTESGSGLKPQDFIYTLNRNDSRDVYFEGSYYSFPETTWMNEKYSSLLCPPPIFSMTRKHYLGFLKSIDYAQLYASSVHKVIEIVGTGGGQTQPRNFHSRPSIPNGNWLWFQAYASIIHGAGGIWFWGLPWAFTNEEASKKNRWESSGPLNDRFMRPGFPNNYNQYVSNLSKELRYLSNKGFIQKEAELFSNEDQGDIYDIISNYQVAWSGPYGGYGQFPISWQSGGTPLDQYGIRYSIRSNGSEVIMIAANPVNAGVIVDFNFNCVPNRIMREATSVDILFHETNDYSVTTNFYKTVRSNSVDLATNTVLRKLTRSHSGGNLQLFFGPLDVLVIKFNMNTSSLANGNGWDLEWSNEGGGDIGGWTMKPWDKIFPGDFDGDGEDELLLVGDAGTSGDWLALLKMVNGQWAWKWSNYGNGSHALHAYSGDFLVGDFDGDGKDELLGNNTWTTMFKWNGTDWTWMWSDYGSASNPIRPYKDRFYVGDFNGDGKDDVLGCDLPSGYTTIFTYNGSGLVWGYWSDNGSSHAMKPYRASMVSGDFNADGKDELLGLGAWATLFNFTGSGWGWMWSTNGSSSFNGWNYPLSPWDRIVVGNFDGDAKDELMFLSTGPSASWAQSQDFNVSSPGWNFNWVANNTYAIPFIDDWPINDGFGFNTRYFKVRTTLGNSNADQLLATRDYCSLPVSQYRTSIASLYDPNGVNKSSMGDTPDPSSSLVPWPNPVRAGELLHIDNPIGELGGSLVVQLVDVTGRVLTLEALQINGGLEVRLPIDSSGLYVLQVQTQPGTFRTARLLVVR